jgi:hypothetical protein
VACFRPGSSAAIASSGAFEAKGREGGRQGDSLGRPARSRAARRRNRMRRIWELLLVLALCASLPFFLIEVWQIVEFIYR